jgi:hypothetical protein
MNRKLTDEDIELVCRGLLQVQRHVTVRVVQDQLEADYDGFKGRTSRICKILKRLKATTPLLKGREQENGGSK